MPDPLDAEDDREDPKGPPTWRIDVDAEELERDQETPDRFAGYLTEIPEGGACLRFSNPDAEDGMNQCAGPLSWLNSARVTLDPEEDSVHFSASIFDPRGGYGFTIRRIPGGDNAGVLVIHTPYQGAGMQHQNVRHITPGTVEVVHDPELPRLPDEGDLLRDAVAMLREELPARRRIAVGPAASSFWKSVREWEHVRDLMAKAQPVRVAMPEEE